MANPVEGYYRQIQQIIKTKASFPIGEAVRKIMFLANWDITQKWTMPIRTGPKSQPVKHPLRGADYSLAGKRSRLTAVQSDYM
jgi:hypothetical protein